MENVPRWRLMFQEAQRNENKKKINCEREKKREEERKKKVKQSLKSFLMLATTGGRQKLFLETRTSPASYWNYRIIFKTTNGYIDSSLHYTRTEFSSFYIQQQTLLSIFLFFLLQVVNDSIFFFFFVSLFCFYDSLK